MKFFTAAALFASVFALAAEATPTPTTGGAIPALLARGGSTKQTAKDCSSSEFYYEMRSCCLTKGGPKTTPKAPSGLSCPTDYYFHTGQGCCVPRAKPTATTTPSCPTKGWSWSKGLQCCTKPSTTTTPSPPTKSKSYDKNEKKTKHRRSYEDETALASCPSDLTSCPVTVNGIPTGDNECIDTVNDVNSCGGCASQGLGKVCSTGQQCVSGECVSY